MLAQRIATAAVAIPILLVLIWIGGWPYTIVAAFVLSVAAAEVTHLRLPWLDFDTLFAALFVLGTAIAAHVDARNVLFAAALGLIVIPLQHARHARTTAHASGERVSIGNAFRGGGLLAAGVLYVGVLGSAIILLRQLDDGRDWVLLALFTTFAVDTAAYFVGRAIGRHRLAPTISPKKTWEGFAGGWVGGLAAALALNAVLDTDAKIGAAILIGVTLPLAAAAGDLLESWIKRRAGVKDASELIPGHGGVLDRLDSVLFTFPLVYAVARWLA